jgi:uncharacterized protein (TIGR02453 family)
MKRWSYAARMWSPAAVAFLEELHANNDRVWFKANKARYDELLSAPARALAATLSFLGEPHFFRPYNDTRFREGPPIKELVAVALGPGAAGYYFDLSLDGVMVAAGLNRPAADQLARYRAAIDDSGAAEAFEQALATASAAALELPEPELKRAPRGYPQDHPRVERLRHKEITVYHRIPLGPWVHTPECDERIRAQLEAGRPLVEWLTEHVGAARR